MAGYGLSLNDHLSQSGWDDPGSQSSQAARLADSTFGRDTAGDVLVLYTAPEGKTVDDPELAAKVKNSLNTLVANHPDEILKINGAYWPTNGAPALPALADESRQHAVASIAIAGGDDDTALTNNFRVIKDEFAIDGVEVQLAGLQPIAGALNDTMANDIKRMEILAIPAVGILLFFVFGGVVAASLPLITGGLTIIAANGVVRFITNFAEVNSFVAPVVSLIGLGLAIDYGLFMVSRFREELAEGYETAAAVRRTVVTAGRTVVFSATMVVTSLGGLLLFPQAFLKSVAYGAIAAVSLAALTSITLLPAILSILGKRIDKFGLKRFGQIQSNEQIENSLIGRLTRWVMRNPLKVTIPHRHRSAAAHHAADRYQVRRHQRDVPSAGSPPHARRSGEVRRTVPPRSACRARAHRHPRRGRRRPQPDRQDGERRTRTGGEVRHRRPPRQRRRPRHQGRPGRPQRIGRHHRLPAFGVLARRRRGPRRRYPPPSSRTRSPRCSTRCR